VPGGLLRVHGNDVARLQRLFDPLAVTLLFSAFNSYVVSSPGGFGSLGVSLMVLCITALVLSVEDLGSVFTVIIPYETEIRKPKKKEEAVSPNQKNPAGIQQLHVLLVEDNEINQLYAGSILRNWGVRLDMAENGLVALEKLKSIRPDLILMDVQMPVMDGFEASRSIRSGQDPVNKIPIIALTANATQGILQKCKACGMNDYLPKPFSPEELQHILAIYAGKIKPAVPLNEPTDHTPTDWLDLSYLRRVSNNDSAFIRQIAESFLQNAKLTTSHLEEGIKTKNIGVIASAAHKIKPSLVMIGAEQCRASAAMLEELAETDSNNGKLFEEADRFNDLLFQTIRELEGMMSDL